MRDRPTPLPPAHLLALAALALLVFGYLLYLAITA